MAQMLNHEESRKPNNTQRRAPKRVEVTPNITVNSNPSWNQSAFSPSSYSTTPGASINFQAAGNSAVNFYVFLEGKQSTALFGGTQPYSAATAANNGTTLTVQSGAAHKNFILSLNSSLPPPPADTDPRDGEIRVGT